jgi:hypothetical protein
MGGERGQRGRTSDRERRDRCHFTRVPGLHQRQHDPAGAEHHQSRAKIVDAVSPLWLLLLQETAEHYKGRRTDRQIDPEDE